MTQMRIGEWGGNMAVRIPHAIAEKLGLQKGQSIDFSLQNGEIVLKPHKKRLTLEEMCEIAKHQTPPALEWDDTPLPTEWPVD